MQLYDSLRTIHLDTLAEKVGGRHRLTYLISQRLRAVTRGAPLLVERQENEALLAAVCREVSEGKVWLEVPEAKPEGEVEDFDILGLGEDL